MTYGEFAKAFRVVVDAYKRLGYDLSYMDFKISPQPVYTDGTPCHELDPSECAGDWTRAGYVRLNPDLVAVMDRYGFERNSADDVASFAKTIIAHELAHEIYNNIASSEAKKDVLDRAAAEGFSTVYLSAVRQNKLEEETFCEYMAHLACRLPLEFRRVGEEDVKAILSGVESYSDNDRFAVGQFSKYYGEESGRLKMWYGCFSRGKCTALAVLKKIPDGFILMAEVQAVVKGYGKLLIENILERSRNVWWCVDPAGGDGLVEYYRQFGAEEHLIKMSKWTDSPQYVFFKASDENRRKQILDEFDKADMTSEKYSGRRL